MDIAALLGDEASSLLDHKATAFPNELFTTPGPDYINDVFTLSDRSPTVLRNLGALYGHGRLAGTGYVSILPVDQGIEHSAAASFAPNPEYFDPAPLRSRDRGGCNAIASTSAPGGGVAALRAQDPLHRQAEPQRPAALPEHLRPVACSPRPTGADLGAVGVGATIYFGSEESDASDRRRSRAAFAEAHRLGMFTVLWSYLRNDAFKTDGVDYHLSADLTGQANHLGVTIEADIIKQKQPENNGGYNAVKFGKTTPRSTPS